jgi:hypothetical protein
VGHVGCTGGEKRCIKTLFGSPKGKDHSEELGADCRTVRGWEVRTGLVAGSCTHGRASGFQKGGEFPKYPNDRRLVKKDSAPRS